MTIEETIARLYLFIEKMLVLLEDDLENKGSNDQSLKFKKNLSSILDRLTTMLAQLEKLNKEEKQAIENFSLEEDLEIIKRFLEGEGGQSSLAKE